MDEKKAAELDNAWDVLQKAIVTEEDFYFFFGRLLEKKILQVIKKITHLEQIGAFDKTPESKNSH